MTTKHSLHRLALLAGLVVYCVSVGAAESAKKNVLFIGVDDMRVLVNAYGQTQMRTPNIDRLAARGLLFQNAYVQQAVCAASRASLLTGCRPDTTGVNYPYSPWFINTFLVEHETIPTFFAHREYYTRTLGKIHHGPSDKGMTEPHFNPKAKYYALKENQYSGKKPEWADKVKPWEHADLPDNKYADGQICDEAIATIGRAVKSGKPFFIAPGFKKPHLPFVCPKKYFDLYDHAAIELSPHPKLGPNQPDLSISRDGAYKWSDFKEKGISDDDARQLIHSYYACVSFIDAQVGRLFDELDAQGVADNTIIMFWSDHGWHLGDHDVWGKSTNYEVATRSPLIVCDPGMKEKGKQTTALVEYVDMFPTLADLAGLEAPAHLEGTSFAPLLDDAGKPWKKAAFSQFPRGSKEGYSVRTAEWRYTEWRQNPKGTVLHRELYHTSVDPIETKNLTGRPEHERVEAEMKSVLVGGWQRALPSGVVNKSDNPRGDDSFYSKGKKK